MAPATSQSHAPSRSEPSLDETVDQLRAELARRDVPAPDVLIHCATGVGQLPDSLRRSVEVPLGELEGVPEPWDRPVLFAGKLGAASIWLLDDLAGDPIAPTAGPPWRRALPTWLAAAAGACLCVHTSAGIDLREPDSPAEAPRVRLGIVRDHLQLGGHSPLGGLGESRLGPLFPDLSQLHHLGLRHAALERAPRMGLAVSEVIAACTAGPAQSTPAERRMLAHLGADVAVPALAPPLLAAGHAGLTVLSLVLAVSGSSGTDVAPLVELAGDTQPRLEELILALSDDIDHAVKACRHAEPRA